MKRLKVRKERTKAGASYPFDLRRLYVEYGVDSLGAPVVTYEAEIVVSQCTQHMN